MSTEIWVLTETLRGTITDATFTMLAAGRALADGIGGTLTAVVLGDQPDDWIPQLGITDSVAVLQHPALTEFDPSAYHAALTPLLKENQPRAVLLAHTTTGMDLAGHVAHALGAPLVGGCSTFSLEEGAPRFTSIVCGGKLLATGEIPDGPCVLTVMPGGYKPEEGRREGQPAVNRMTISASLDDLPTRLVQYLEPESGDVDIAKEPILVSIGRGIQGEDNVALARSLADVLGGAISASRPVVDRGWLPATRLVGKSGKSVRPKLYLALGISGAPEHLEGLADPELLVAINTDEKAPIFDFAHYGAQIDVLELIPILTERIQGVAHV